MTSIVTVTPASQTATVGRDGIAEHAFSVTNTTGAPLTVGTKVLADPPAQESWFTIAGAAERELAANETDQVTVEAKPPADAPAGQYKLRLLVFSVARGRAGEDFTEGPTVAVEIPAKDQPAPRPKPFPWWIVGVAAAAVLVLGGLITWLVWPKAPEVPTLVGLPLQQALDKLETIKLVPGEVREELTGQATGGTVTGQTPEPGEVVDKGSKVDLVIEAVSIEVPKLTGKNVAEAQQALKTAGLAVGVVKQERTGSAPGGTVLWLDPPEGKRVLPQTPVNLVVEAQSVAVPRLIGQTLGEATQTLRGCGLTVGQVTQRRTGATPGVVLSQNPAEGQSVAPGSAVALTVEQQSIRVPPLTSLSIERAMRKLSDEGLRLGSVTRRARARRPASC